MYIMIMQKKNYFYKEKYHIKLRCVSVCGFEKKHFC